MTWAANPTGTPLQWTNPVTQEVRATDARVGARPLGATAVGFFTTLVSAWAAISVFVGPDFGYNPTTSTSWAWTMQNWLLHLVPGAVGAMAGIMMMGASIGLRDRRRAPIGIAAVLAMAAGAWLVVGPAAYSWFQSAAPYALAQGARDNFLNQIGANLGPGVLLAILGGMALKAGTARRTSYVEAARVVVRSDEAPVPQSGWLAAKIAASADPPADLPAESPAAPTTGSATGTFTGPAEA